MMDYMYVFKLKSFRNTRHTVTFGISLQSYFLNTLYMEARGKIVV
jgi:hypothetical protein